MLIIHLSITYVKKNGIGHRKMPTPLPYIIKIEIQNIWADKHIGQVQAFMNRFISLYCDLALAIL